MLPRISERFTESIRGLSSRNTEILESNIVKETNRLSIWSLSSVLLLRLRRIDRLMNNSADFLIWATRTANSRFWASGIWGDLMRLRVQDYGRTSLSVWERSKLNDHEHNITSELPRMKLEFHPLRAKLLECALFEHNSPRQSRKHGSLDGSDDEKWQLSLEPFLIFPDVVLRRRMRSWHFSLPIVHLAMFNKVKRLRVELRRLIL